MSLKETSVAFFIFNRPGTTQRVFEAIANARPPRLFVIADGPRADHPDDLRLCREARAVVARVDWPCEVLTRFSDTNLGCELSITGGLDWVFSQVRQAIILEDDCLPDPSFFPFCEEMLQRYREDERVHMVKGCSLLNGRRFGPWSYHFSRFTNVWGWATWARAWKHYDIEMRRWPEFRDNGWLERHLPTVAMARMARRYFDARHEDHAGDWEYPMTFAAWIRNAVAVAPATNLVTNIGFGPGASQTHDPVDPIANLSVTPLHFPLSHPPVVEVLETADAHEWAVLNPGPLRWDYWRRNRYRWVTTWRLGLRALASKLRRHWRAGTLPDAVRLHSPRLPDASRVLSHGRSSQTQAARMLGDRARLALSSEPAGRWVLSVGDGDAFQNEVHRWLVFHDVPFRAHRLEEVLGWNAAATEGVAAVLAAYPDARRRTRAARALAGHKALAGVLFEYPFGLNPEAASFDRFDEYPDTFFVSPVLLDNPSPYALYEESLRYFQQKCGLRDFLDLYQLLHLVVRNKVPGDIAEFGSYQGHSGWLIASTLKALGSNKRLFMFDTFDKFPHETLGVDRFWSDSHPVTFDHVREKLQAFDNVCLVKGDFTRTLDASELNAVALAHVDCDSYRATRFALDALLQKRLSHGGLIACEDYGHPALLGHRAAVHDSLDGTNGLFHFFSQFSGFYIVGKP